MTPQSEKKPPTILEEEDTPFSDDDGKSDDELAKDTHAQNDIDWRKLSIGSSTLGWCVFLMFLCVVISLFVPDNEMLDSAFEAFKLIVMTVLGYIFGSNTKS